MGIRLGINGDPEPDQGHTTQRLNRLIRKTLREKRSGAEGQNRTADTMIFSHVLYRLSYLGIIESNYSTASS